MPSHCQHNNDSSLELPALMSVKPSLIHGTNCRKGVGNESAHKKALFQVCYTATLRDLCFVGLPHPTSLLLATSHRVSYGRIKAGLSVARRAGFGLGFGLWTKELR